MDEKELLEFDIEDIIREFHDDSAQVQEDALDDETVYAEAETGGETEQPDAAVPQMGDTVRFEPVSTESSVDGATIRLDKIPVTHGTVRNAQPITDEEDMEPVIPEQPEKTEPYSEEWEPEYEQPIAEYVPPRPIIFQPRSRLRELKRKLVAGPEKMYYALTEQGLGKLQITIFFSVLVVLLSAGATILYAAGGVSETRMKLMVFGQFLAMLVSALLGCYQLMEGAAALLRRRFSLNTLLLFTFVLCCVDGVLCLHQLRVPCCAAFSLQVTMSLWNTYQKRNTKLGQLDTMRKATRLDSIGAVEDYHEGGKGLLRGEGQVEDFMDTLDQPARHEKVLSVYALVALCISIALGVAAGVLRLSLSAGIQVAAVTCLAAMPASMFVTLSRPMAVLERRHHALGTVLCGWQGVEALCGKAVFPVEHDDLLPVSNIKMNGVKFYGDRQPDQVIAYGAALISAHGGSLKPLFDHLLESRNGMHYTAENCRFYEDGGIGGEVNGEPVLLGSQEFLKQMGVEMPEGIRVNHAVYVAVDGEMCGLFALAIDVDRSSSAGLATLCGYRGLRPILVSGDFMLTEEFISNSFDVRTKRILFPEYVVRAQLRERKLEPESQAAALVTSSGLAPFAYAVTGARALKNACTAGTAVHMAGGILGIVMMIVLVLLGRIDLLTPASMFLYEMIWMVPGLLITQWTRSL